MKCSYYREKGYCSKGNHPVDTNDMGECIYKNGEITDKASIHCSEGKKQLGIKDKFLVFKIDDIQKHLNNPDKSKLAELSEKICDGRHREGKAWSNQYLVVNKDESYAPLVEHLILNKVSVDDIPEKIKEEILKEYAEDLFEEFLQIARFEGKITLKDIKDILQL